MTQRKKYFWGSTLLFIAVIALSILVIPIPNEEQKYSHVLYDREGNILAAQVASDQQWRFPISTPLPESFRKCIRFYEDEYFYRHPGINPVSALKALWTNLREGEIVRGGSTLSMQVMRMYRGNRSRTYWQKAIESLGALKLEMLHSKEEIVQMWASRAPFGGNTVGATTAAWRYFQRDLNNLSLAEYATLAVLPNSPSRVHLSRNTSLLKKRRDFLLKKLWSRGVITSMEYRLYIEEEVPEFQSKLPQKAHHLLQFCRDNNKGLFEFHSTVDLHLQERVQSIVDEFSQVYQKDDIQNASALIIDNQKNELLAYVGNSEGIDTRYVDCIQAPRSYGSLLKPFLYAYALDQGYFLPRELLKDIPTNVQGFAPKNFDRKYRGWIRFDDMVSQSLNVPAVRSLNYVGLESFHATLKYHLGLQHIQHNPHHHGLSLILGGAEASLWEMARLYKGLALDHSDERAPYREVSYLEGKKSAVIPPFSFHPTAIHHTLEAMASVERPPEEQQFVKYGGSPISWKTGTSYGHRDAWAIGLTPEYTVAVWVGNEEGKGVYNLTGAKKAAPILFRIFGSLPTTSEFPDVHATQQIRYCLETGRLKGPLCQNWRFLPASPRFHHLRQCHLHEIQPSSDTVLIMDPVANYYRQKYQGQRTKSPGTQTQRPRQLRIVYPTADRVVFVPKKLDRETSRVKVAANSNKNEDKVFWYLDGQFQTTTTGLHELHLDLSVGTHQLYVVNQDGQEDRVRFEVVMRKRQAADM